MNTADHAFILWEAGVSRVDGSSWYNWSTSLSKQHNSHDNNLKEYGHLYNSCIKTKETYQRKQYFNTKFKKIYMQSFRKGLGNVLNNVQTVKAVKSSPVNKFDMLTRSVHKLKRLER